MVTAEDRGVLESWVALLMLGLLAMAALIALVGSLYIRHEQAQAAADFAALSALQSPRGCAAATEAAARNRARLDSCALGIDDIRVRASVPSGVSELLLRLGVPPRFAASSHASL
ncbi:MAG: Rv3654c family TadE-like protein [Candidatus Nanopelagicales bacterium]